MLKRILQPYYIWRPGQIVRALYIKLAGRQKGSATIKLPWGAAIRFPTHDYIGHQLSMHGIIAMEACEAVARLLDEGETAVDAGANVGTVSSIMARRVGKTGQVSAFEMMPQTFAYLHENVESWKAFCPKAEAHQCALSDRESVINIGLSPDFQVNTGVAYATRGEVHPGHQVTTAQAKRLDAFFPSNAMIHFLKLDVERHELEVLQGAGSLLTQGRIRDIVFEDVALADSPVKQLLASLGYSLLTMRAGLSRIDLIPFHAADHAGNADEYCDYLATRDVKRTLSRWAKGKYYCLSTCND